MIPFAKSSASPRAALFRSQHFDELRQQVAFFLPNEHEIIFSSTTNGCCIQEIAAALLVRSAGNGRERVQRKEGVSLLFQRMDGVFSELIPLAIGRVAIEFAASWRPFKGSRALDAETGKVQTPSGIIGHPGDVGKETASSKSRS
jgi:hypothetical protein